MCIYIRSIIHTNIPLNAKQCIEFNGQMLESIFRIKSTANRDVFSFINCKFEKHSKVESNSTLEIELKTFNQTSSRM